MFRWLRTRLWRIGSRKHDDQAAPAIEPPHPAPPEAVLYDAALTLPDQDRLGRKGFAQSLAQAILSMDASQPFIFALQGSWGSGKSTVLNFVRFFLNHPKLLGEAYPDLPPILIVTFVPAVANPKQPPRRQDGSYTISNLRNSSTQSPLRQAPRPSSKRA